MRPAKSSGRRNESTRSSPRSTAGTRSARSGSDSAVTQQRALELDAGMPSTAARDGGQRIVDVAVDAVGAAGARTYSYAVPDRLADLQPGEAVLVDFGSRQALGIVLGDWSPAPGVDARPIVDRVRSDG